MTLGGYPHTLPRSGDTWLRSYVLQRKGFLLSRERLRTPDFGQFLTLTGLLSLRFDHRIWPHSAHAETRVCGVVELFIVTSSDTIVISLSSERSYTSVFPRSQSTAQQGFTDILRCRTVPVLSQPHLYYPGGSETQRMSPLLEKQRGSQGYPRE